MTTPPDAPVPPSLPWWKRPALWLLALGGILATVLAFLRSRASHPAPPPPPDVPTVKIPVVNTQPSTTYEEAKVQPPAAPTDEAVDDAIARLNAGDGK